MEVKASKMPSIKRSHHDNPSAEVINNNNQVIIKYDGMYPKLPLPPIITIV